MSVTVSNTLESLFVKMENYVSTKTVVGEAIHIGDVIIVPVVDVSFVVGAGSAEGSKEKDSSETSGGLLSGKIMPSAVLVIINGNVQLVNIKNQDSLNKLIDMVPGIASKLNLGAMFGKKPDKENKENKEKPADDSYPENVDEV